jgi:hypothetical protein
MFLAGIGGWLYWQDRQRSSPPSNPRFSAQTYSDVGAGKMATVPPRLDTLASDGGDVVRATALFARAVAIEQNDRKLAVSKFREIADDTSLAQPHRDLALLLGTALEFDSIKPEEVICQNAAIVQAWVALVRARANSPPWPISSKGRSSKRAGCSPRSADKQVPDSIRARAVQVAGTLGVDASASLPASAQ